MNTEVNNNIRDSAADVFLKKEDLLFEKSIKEGNYSKVKKLLSSGVFVNKILSTLPPLSLALECSRFDIAQFFISSGADVCQLDSTGKFCPMFYSIKNRCPLNLLRRLISAGVPKDGVVEYMLRGTPLHLAVYANYKAAVKCLLDLSADVSCRDANGLTPLHVAVQRNHPKIIRLLVQNGASVDAECNEKFTPLMYAIHDNSLPLVRLMLSLGSDVNHEPNLAKYSYQRPLNYAAGLGLMKIVEELLNHAADVNSLTSTGDSALHSVAFSNKFQNPADTHCVNSIIQTLLDHGADLENVNNDGHCPLHVSVIMRNKVVTKALITMGSRVTSSDSRSNQPIHIAATIGDAWAVKLLLKYGADASIKNEAGMTAYDMALTQSDLSTVRTFWACGLPFDKSKLLTKEENRDCGIKINKDIQPLWDQQKLLFHGIEKNDLNSVREVLENGAEARGCGLKIKHPLHFCVAHGLQEILFILLQKGVPVGSLDENGKTPLHLAVEAGHEEICHVLLSYGACYNYCSKQCPQTPLQVATRLGHSRLKQLFSEIYKLFVGIKGSDTPLVKEVLRLMSIQNKILFWVVLNCVNRRGLTLMAKAIENSNSEITEFIMQHRLDLIN